MDENKLLKISLVFSLLGILVILYISETVSPPLTKIVDITKEKIDEKVKIQGVLISIINTKTISILNIEDHTGKINVILFENKTNLQKNQKVEVLGTITEYKDHIEIIADQIKTI
jgi:DNA/RNA endonuclease YhcR with UshA esterase domain